MIRPPDRTDCKQKVIIPKDTIKQDEIAVIEIPYEYQNEPVVVVKPKLVEICKSYNAANTTNEKLKMMNKGNINSNVKTPKNYENQTPSIESVTEDSSLIKLDQKDMLPKMYKKIITTTITENLNGKIKKTTTTTTTRNREITSTTELDKTSEKVDKGTTHEHKKKKQVLNDTCGLHAQLNNSDMMLPDESSNNFANSSSGGSKLNYTESNLKLHTPKNIELVAGEKELEMSKRSHTLIATVPEKVADKKNKSSKLDKKDKKKYGSKNDSVKSSNEEVRSFKKIVKKTTMTKSPTNGSSGLNADIKMKKCFEPCSSIPSQPLPCSLIGQMYVGEMCNASPNYSGIQDSKLNRPNININQFNERQQDNKYKQMVNHNETNRFHYNNQSQRSNDFRKTEYNQMNSGYMPSYIEPVKMQQGQIYGSAISPNNQMNNEHVYLNQDSFGKMQQGQMNCTYCGHNNANIINTKEIRGFVPYNEINNLRNAEMIQSGQNIREFISNENQMIQINNNRPHFIPNNQDYFQYNDQQVNGNFSPCNVYQNNSDAVNIPLPSCISEGSEVQKGLLNQVNTTASRPNKNINGNGYKVDVTQQNQYIPNNVQKEDFITDMSLNSNFGIQPDKTNMQNANIPPTRYIVLDRTQAIMQPNLINSTLNTPIHSNNSNISAIKKENNSESNNLRMAQPSVESSQFSHDIKSGQMKTPVSSNAENNGENVQISQMGNTVGSTSTGAGDTKPILKRYSVGNNQNNMDTGQSSFDTNNTFNNINIESVTQQIPSSNLESNLTSKKPEQNNNTIIGSGSDAVREASATNKLNNLDILKSEMIDRALNIEENNNANTSVTSNTQQSSLINNKCKNSQPENQKSNTIESIPSYKRTITTTITRKTSEDEHLEKPLADTPISYISQSLNTNPTYKKVIKTTTVTKSPLDNTKLALLQSMDNYFQNSNIKNLKSVNYSNKSSINPSNLGSPETYQTENYMSIPPPHLYNSNLDTMVSNNYKFKYPIGYPKRLNSISGYSTITNTMGIFPHIYEGINRKRTQKNENSLECSVSENSFGLLPSAHLNTTDYFNNNEFKSNCNEMKKTSGNNQNYVGLLPTSFLNRCASIEKSIGLLNNKCLHHKLITLPKRPSDKEKSCNSVLESAPTVNKNLKINDSLELLNAKLENYNYVKEDLEKQMPELLKAPQSKEYTLLNHTLVEQLHKAETAEKVKLQDDLEKYQQARRQLIANASKLGTPKETNLNNKNLRSSECQSL